MAENCFEAVFMTWFVNKPFGLNCCKCCDSLCRCACCYDAGEFDPNDYPENQSKAELSKKEQETKELPAYSKANEMQNPSSRAPQATPQVINETSNVQPGTSSTPVNQS